MPTRDRKPLSRLRPSRTEFPRIPSCEVLPFHLRRAAGVSRVADVRAPMQVVRARPHRHTHPRGRRMESEPLGPPRSSPPSLFEQDPHSHQPREPLYVISRCFSPFFSLAAPENAKSIPNRSLSSSSWNLLQRGGLLGTKVSTRVRARCDPSRCQMDYFFPPKFYP